MTTFAAVLADDCRLSLEPLHADDPRGPVVLPESGIAIVGTALIEAAGSLAAQLDLPSTTTPLAIVASAYARWGSRFAEHIAGEYAIALWDPRERLLLCARDPFGIRRLFIASGRQTLVATNCLALALSHPHVSNTLDEDEVAAFLANGGHEDPVRTIYKAVRLVPAGHTLVVHTRPQRSELFRHWHPPAAARHSAAPRDVLARFREALTSAVIDRIGGGHAALLLSGGIDSAAIAAAAVNGGAGARLRAVTCCYTTVDAANESEYAAAAAAQLGMPLAVVPADGCVPLAASREGPPVPDPIDEPRLADWRALLREAARSTSVILHGEDGDALLSPPGFQPLLREQSAARLAGAIARFTMNEGGLPYLGIRLKERLGLSHPSSAPSAPPWLTSAALERLKRAEPARLLGHLPTPSQAHASRPETFRRLGNVAAVLAPVIAPETTGIAAEVRYPLLDSRVIAAVVDAPAIPWLQSKRLMRTVFRDRLPLRTVQRRKTAVAGAYEAMVASWRAAAPRPQNVRAVDEWVDERALVRSMTEGSCSDVLAAWRAIMLAAWLERRREVETSLCTR